MTLRGEARALVAVCLASSWLGCAPEIPDATYVCTTTDQCPPEMTCVGGLCRRGTLLDAGPCVPLDCTGLRAECGPIDDGCGREIECGECQAPEVCGVAGEPGRIPNICDCQPSACDPDACGGAVSNGCGGTIDCGGCDNGRACTDGMCTCTPLDCTGRCRDVPDGCGEILHCPECPAGETCGAGGPNVCGTGSCVPRPCMPGDCGPHADGCGDIVQCGDTCVAPATCGGGDPGVPGVCGCTPQTCADIGPDTCGEVVDVCGNTRTCPGCAPPETCGGGGVDNQCGCTPPACAPGQCGIVESPCGGTRDCGTCPGGEACVANMCSGGCADEAEENDSMATAYDLGVLPAVTMAYTTFNVEPGTADPDWYTFGTLGGVRLTRTVTASLTGGQLFPLGVYFQCVDGETAAFTCGPGARRNDELQGCEADPSTTDTHVSITFECRNPAVFVAVSPKALSTSCTPYTLRVSQPSIVTDPPVGG